VLGVDPSSVGIASTLIVAGEPRMTIKIELGAGDLYARLYRARKYFPKVLDICNPDFVVIEQTILIQNPETTRKLSYTVGILMAETLMRGISLMDVPPATWKSYLGIKPMTKRRKDEIISKLGETEGRKEISRLKKSPVQDILKERFPNFSWEDNDVADSAGIGLWGFDKYGIKASL